MPVSLRVRKEPNTMFHTDHMVYDAASNAAVFHLANTKFSNHVALIDAATDKIIGHRCSPPLNSGKLMHICADQEGDHVLLTVRAKEGQSIKAELRNMVNGKCISVWTDGDWNAAVVSMDQGDGEQLRVARIYRPDHSSEYRVDIAPNMDHLLVVVLCLALKLRKNNHREEVLSSSPVGALVCMFSSK